MAFDLPANRAPVGYPPLDTPRLVAEGLWIVDSLLPGAVGRVLPARMTALRLADGLLLHSPTRFSPALLDRLQQIGPIRHLVAPNSVHWMFLAAWQRACPGAVTWAVPGLRARRVVRRGGVRLDHDLGGRAPGAWRDAVALVTVPGGLGFREAALFHRATRTLVLTDLVVNLDAATLPRLVLPAVRLLGTVGPDGMPPAWLRAVVRLKRRDAAAAALRRSMRWLLG